MRFLHAVAVRHPELLEGLDGQPLGEGTDALAKRWFKLIGAEALGGSLFFGSQLSEDHDGSWVVVDFEPLFAELKAGVQAAEKVKRRLGQTVLSTLDRCAYAMELFTPLVAFEIAQWLLWHDATTDAEYIESAIDNGEDPDDLKPGSFFGPDAYKESFDSPMAFSRKLNPMGHRALARLAKRERNSWQGQLAALLLRLRREEQALAMPFCASRSAYQPSALLRWTEDDAVGHVVDNFVEYHMNGGEGIEGHLVRRIDDDTEALASVLEIEDGLRLMQTLHELVDHLERGVSL